MNNVVIELFVHTDEYFRFMEFCDACKKYRYIGLCYGPPSVGKTRSARRYAAWDRLQSFDPNADSAASLFEELEKNGAVLVTPAVNNTPRQIADGVHAEAAIVRITGGNFRLLHRLLSQIGRILEINQLLTVTAPVVDAARESLVIGTA